MDGIETCYELRKINTLKNTCIAFLTARGEDYTQIAGFEAGADDFITKPIRLNILLPRLKAHLNRIDRSHDGKVLEIEDMQIVVDKYIVRKGDKTIRLSRKEFHLLCLFANNPHRVFTLKEIFSRIWGKDSPAMDRTVNVHISRLRKKLDRELIVSSGGSGYRLK
jgi:two-component system alkaline phosphatase synthesis response regulator PhoP